MELLVEEDLASSSSRLWGYTAATSSGYYGGGKWQSPEDPYEALIATLDSPRYQKIGDAIKELVA